MRNRNFMAIIACVLLCFFSCKSEKETTDTLDTDEMIAYCVAKVQETSDALSETNKMPRNIEQGESKWKNVGIHDWTSGFWPGILWLSYESSKDPMISERAQAFTGSLEEVLERQVDNHDLGFMMYNSFGNGYRLTKDPTYHKVILTAADSLATLYNPKVGTILSWSAMREKMNWPHNTIIDNLMNLELLFWAAKNGGNERYHDMAVSHAKVSMEALIRPDSSTFHVAVFDTVDGHFLKAVTHQGFADNSMWARGHAWGIYGYTMCYRESGDKEFLAAAQKLSKKFIRMLPKDGIPYWDFNDPSIPNSPKDASAAAVAASGMLELSTLVSDGEEKAKYLNAASQLLSLLSTSDYLSGDKNPSFLMHSTGHKPKESEVDASIIYADYYYLEALIRLKKIENGKNLTSIGF